MQSEFGQLERYLQEALGVTVTAAPWGGREHLPHFLRERYALAEMNVLGVPCLLMIDAGREGQSPGVVRKHMDLLRSKWRDEIIYVRLELAAYQRKRLIEQKVPFVVPGNQMYLPMLGIDLREHFRRLRAEPLRLSPATQVMVLDMLLRGSDRTVIPLEIARRLGYSPMTMTRAFDELEAVNLGEITIHGRERRLRFTQSKQQIWARAQPLLRNPVSKRVAIPKGDVGAAGLRAGLSALAEYSMLAPPAYPIVAMSREDWKTMRQREQAPELPLHDPDAQEIEVWIYPPALLAEHGMVDPLSLYLSLKDSQDECVALSLDEMMETLKWVPQRDT